jgi:diacylglycerol kinase family enzyme
VIFNPTAGRGRAGRRLQQLRRELANRAVFEPTRAPGHGEELALMAARNGFLMVAAAGGDGTVHEVANGLLRANRPEVILAVAPIGSANDYAYTLSQGGAGVRSVDVGMVSGAGGRQRYFINGLGLGFNGAVTLESRRIRGLQGVALYGVALLRALYYRFACPIMAVTRDGLTRQGPTLALTVNLGNREGGFVMAPHARLDDGKFDYVHAGELRRWEMLRFVPGMITGKMPQNHRAIWMGQCRQVSVQSETALTVHVDGEFFSRPEDDVRSIDIQLLPGALRVQRL